MRTQTRIGLAFGLTLTVALLALAPRAEADDRTWVNGESGDWNNAANWVGSSVPGSSDSALWTSVNGSTFINNINVNGQYSISDLKMDWAGTTFNGAVQNVNLNGTVAGASVVRPK